MRGSRQLTCLYSMTMAGKGWKGSNCDNTASDVDVSCPTFVLASFTFPTSFELSCNSSNRTCNIAKK